MEFSQEEIESVLKDVVNLFLIPKFRELGMNASGEWENSIEVRGNEIWGRDYTQYLVEGRTPNNNQDPEALRSWAVWAGSTFIKDWANNKGVNINPIAIAYKIGREGTEYYPQGTDLLEVLSSKEVEQFISDELSRFIIVKVQEEFKRAFK